MTDLLPALAAYVPPDLVRATVVEPSPAPLTEAQARWSHGAVLFADVSGFTPLTEALALKGAEGPEELTRLLNGYFGRMIALIQEQGGEVVQFSGDAVTVVFPAVDESLGMATRRAVQAAEAMQAAMGEFAALQTSAGPVALGMKIGLGAGKILVAQVGGVHGRWEYVIAGDPLRQVAQAEHQASRGEIVLSPRARALVVSQPLAPRRRSEPDWSQVRDPAAVEAVLRGYVPTVVSAWLREELHEWLAVLRPMSVLFIGIAGIEYDRSDAVERLHGFLRATQEIVRRYEGTMNKLRVDDKGTVSIILFGAPPHAHEDDPERALRCALDLQALAHARGLELAIGVTTGRVFAGPVGSETRREYTVMGDTVNLAARLMGVAGAGQVRCDYETYRDTRTRLAFDLLAPVRIKGKAGLIRIYRPTGETSGEEKAGPGGELVGRRAEVDRLAACIDDLHAGRGRLLIIEGDAGIGKSRLVRELTRLLRERGIAGLMGAGRSIEQQTPYRAWRDVFVSYFDLEGVSDAAERRRRVQGHVHDVAPQLQERIPLLNDVLNLGFPENELTASLDAHLRHESLASLLLALLRAWIAEGPLALVLEDAHWLDSLSWNLTLQVARVLTVGRVPLLLVVVMRPMEGETARIEPRTLAGMAEVEHLRLQSMSPAETVALAAVRLGVSGDGLPQPVAELVRTRAGGNPFFAEELVYALRDNGLITLQTDGGETRCLVSGDLDRAAQALPDTIQGIVLSRIDRLPPAEQLTLKVAAVIGRTFAYTTLHETLGENMELSHRLLRAYLDDLALLDLTPLEAPEPELTYIFKHIITQEVAYETLLFAQRRQLHRAVARWYERTFGDRAAEEGIGSPLVPYYPLLVYHWHQAEDQVRERQYAALAGRWAASQFANVEAAAYLGRALELTPTDDLAARYELMLAREAVNDLRGERQEQEQDLVALVLLAEGMGDDRRQIQVALRTANYMEAISDYSAALIAAQRAIEHAARADQAADDTEGYIVWGKVLWRQGDYDAARGPLERALAAARTAHDRRREAQSLYYLGHVFLYQGDPVAAQDRYRQALEIYRAEGARQRQADNLSNLGTTFYDLGDYPAARDCYEQALSVFRTIGDRWGQAIVLNNLGTAYCDWGDYAAARDYHQQALELRLAIGDRQGEAVSLTNLGLVSCCLGDHEAAQGHCRRALAIQREIGDLHGEAYSLTYLGHALAGLGELDAAAGAYDEAIRLRHKLGQQGLAMDGQAGLVRVAMARGELERALECVDEILAWIEDHGLEGIEYPQQVCLTCYRALRASTDVSAAARTSAAARASAAERGAILLSKAHATLLDQASRLSDADLRRQFLESVDANREIMAAWNEANCPARR